MNFGPPMGGTPMMGGSPDNTNTLRESTSDTTATTGFSSSSPSATIANNPFAIDDEPSDIDILLENSTCERFVLRCVENELPPNLIHRKKE